MAARLLPTTVRCDLADGGPYRIVESVTEVDAPVGGRRVALFNEDTLRCVQVGQSDSAGTVTFDALADDGRPFLLVAFDPNNLYASPTVRRVATATGERP